MHIGKLFCAISWKIRVIDICKDLVSKSKMLKFYEKIMKSKSTQVQIILNTTFRLEPVLSRILCKTVRTTVLKCLHKTLHKNVYIKPHTEEVWFHKENFSSPVFPLQVLKGCDSQRWLRNIIHVFPLAHEYLRVKVLTQFQKVVFFR